MALKWLQRAHDTLSICEVDELSLGGLETRLAICQSLIRTYLGQQTAQARQEAERIIMDMEAQLGDKPVVLHWHVELLQHSPREEVDVQTYASILRRMVRAFDRSAENLDFLLHHVKELGERSIQLACALLDELLLQGVAAAKQHEHVGKVLIRRIWFSVKEEDAERSVSALANVLNTLYQLLHEPAEPAAAGAAHYVSIYRKMRGYNELTSQDYLEESRDSDCN